MYRLYLNNWHDAESGPPLSPDEFRDTIALAHVSVLESHRASLHFSDARCFGWHWITFSVDADGKTDEEPFLWG